MPHHTEYAALPRQDPLGGDAWEALMAAALTGDGRAYERLLHAILPMLRGMARRRIADRAEAEDAVQDTLLTIHQLRHSYDPSRPLRPWLATLCERRCIDRLRRRRRQGWQLQLLEHMPEAAQAGAGEAATLDRVAGAEVRAAVRLLPRAQQTAMTLLKLQDLSLAEAAARSGLSVGSLKVAVHRALRTLRARLAAEPA